MPTRADRRLRRRPTVTKFRSSRCEPLESRRLLSAGDLDPSFSSDGRAMMDVPGSFTDTGQAVAVQSDGKIVVASASSQHMAVARYRQDGSLDTAFGSGGTVRFMFGQPFEIPHDVAIDSLGRIVVAGMAGLGPRGGDFAVARLSPAGTLDISFDGDGLALVDFAGSDDGAAGLAIRADNSILLAGTTQPLTPQIARRAFALAALRENGAPDLSFNGNGKVVTPIGTEGAAASDMVVDSAGRIVVGGTAGVSSTGPFVLARYLPDGRLDSSFDVDGLVTTAMTAGALRSLAAAPGGKIVAGGQSNSARGDEEFTAVRYNENGSLDATFDGDGKVFLDLGTTAQPRHDRAFAVAVDPSDGAVILAGTSELHDSTGGLPTDVHGTVVRLTSAGVPDTGFTGDGIDLGRPSQFNALAMLSSGLFFAAGVAPDGTTDGTNDILLAKYGPGGRDLVFGNGDFFANTQGTVTTDVRGPVSNRGHAVAVQGDGKVLVAGDTDTGYGHSTDFGLARFNADGTPDSSFGGTGYVTTDFDHARDALNALAVQGDGKIVAAGTNFGPDGNQDVLIARYLPSGALDPSFGGTGKVTVADVGGRAVQATSLALQGDGKIVVAGGFVSSSTDNMLVFRFNADGTPDNTFGGGDGVAVVPVGAGDFLFARAVALDGLGRIVLAGGQGTVAVVRLDPAGNPDPSFDGDGIAVTRFSDTPGAFGYPFAIGVDASNRVVVAGQTAEGTQQPNDFAVARFLENGTLDPSFGTGGRVVTDFNGADDRARALVVLPGGGAVVAGTSYAASGSVPLDFELAMYTPAGTPDPSFGSGGKVTTDFAPGSTDEAYGVALDGADRVVAGGTAGGDFAAARYTLAPAAPRVLGASVSGSSWSAAFRNYLRDSGLAPNQSGLPVQLAPGGPLPWINLNQVSVTFDQQVQVGANDLRVRGVDGTDYALDAAAFSFDAATRTATWKLANGAVFGADRVRLELDGDSVRAGGRLLDGDNDGDAGGDFVAHFNVLPGDVNRNGIVLADDFSAVKKKFFTGTTSTITGDAAYSSFHDVDGSGVILANDYSEVKKRFFQALPPAESAQAPLAVRRVADGIL